MIPECNLSLEDLPTLRRLALYTSRLAEPGDMDTPAACMVAALNMYMAEFNRDLVRGLERMNQ